MRFRNLDDNNKTPREFTVPTSTISYSKKVHIYVYYIIYRKKVVKLKTKNNNLNCIM